MRSAATKLRIIRENNPSAPIETDLPDASVLAAEQITFTVDDRSENKRVVTRKWSLDDGGTWCVTLIVADPRPSPWAVIERRGPDFARTVGQLLSMALLVLVAVPLLLVWNDPLGWLGWLVANLDLILGLAVAAAFFGMAFRSPYTSIQTFLGAMGALFGLGIGIGMWVLWPEYFSVGERSVEDIGAAAWAHRGQIAASVGAWLVGALTLARLFGIAAPGAMGAAAWLEKQTAMAAPARGGLRRFLGL